MFLKSVFICDKDSLVNKTVRYYAVWTRARARFSPCFASIFYYFLLLVRFAEPYWGFNLFSLVQSFFFGLYVNLFSVFVQKDNHHN